MISNTNILFETDRLIFRIWNNMDVDAMAEINANPEVMRHIPKTATLEETKLFIDKMKLLFEEKSYCYFPVEIKDTGEFIGFIGMMDQNYKSEITPATDIGWRLKTSAWGKGYATEGAKRCLQYARELQTLTHVISTAPKVNTASISVMKKIGMQHFKDFIHPRLIDYERLKECACYRIEL
jgi:RimJ/RimL family protein N-acetyltransferase